VRLDLASVTLPLDPVEHFGSASRVEVELGVGKGRFLLERAAAHPDLVLIGVERARIYLDLAAERVERAGIANVRLLHTTAEDLLFRCLADGTAAAIHFYFPDPWPKRRHHKRRFFKPENVGRIAEVLAPGGTLRVKTDHPGYAQEIRDVLDAEPRLTEEDDLDNAFAGIPVTHYEIKYARESRVVFRFARRRSMGSA
jgi:tRNA (guanine-N7-)-methyltransferase